MSEERCIKCGIVLVNDVNWFRSDYKSRVRYCRACRSLINSVWKKAHPEATRKHSERRNRKIGRTPMPARLEGNDFYVYFLLDENDHVYYIGSGKNDRLNQHKKEVQALLKAGKNTYRGHSVWTEKRKTVRRLLDTVTGYRAEKVATHLTKQESFIVESFWIEVFGLENLTNEAMPFNRGAKPIPAFQPKALTNAKAKAKTPLPV